MTLSVVSLLAGNVDEAAADLAAHLTTAGVDTGLAAVDQVDRRALVESGAADIVWMCGWLALEMGRKDLDVVAAPTFSGEHPASYRSVVISRTQTPGLAALTRDGVVWAMNEPESWSGHRALLAECAMRRLAAPSHIVWSGSHLESIRMVSTGQADAAAIDSTVWMWAGVDGLEVVDATRSWPSPPVLVRRDLLDQLPQLPGFITCARPVRGVDRLDEADWSHLDPMSHRVDT